MGYRFIFYCLLTVAMFVTGQHLAASEPEEGHIEVNADDMLVNRMHQQVEWLTRRTLYDSALKVLRLCDSMLQSSRATSLKHKQVVWVAIIHFNKAQIAVAIDTLAYLLRLPVEDSIRAIATILRCDFLARSRYDKSALADLISVQENPWLQQSLYWQVRWHASHASILDYMGQFDLAAQAYLRSLEYAKKLKDAHVEARVLSGLGSLFNSIGQDSMALHYAALSEAIYARTEENEGLSKLYNISAISLKNMGRLEEAKKYYEKDIAYNSKSGKLSSLVITYHNLGVLLIALNQLDSGGYYIDKSLALCKQIDMQVGLMYNHYGYGNLAYKKEDYMKAISFYELAFDHATDISNLTFQYVCSDSLAAAYALVGAFKQAYFWKSRAQKFVDSLHKVKQAAEIEKLTIQFEEKELRLENDVLRVVNRESVNQIKAQRWIIGMIVLLLIGSVVFVMLLHFTLRKRRKLIRQLLWTQQEVTRQNQALERLNIEVIDQKRVLEERQKALLLSNSLKDTILSVISHDFRSPLTSLSQLVSMLSLKQLDQTTFEDMLPTLDRDVKQNLMLIDNLLLWSRSHMSGERFQSCVLSPKAIFRETVGLYERQIADKELFVNIDLPDTMELDINPEVVSLVARNFISNAIKFNRKNGAISVNSLTDDTHFKLSVTDTGIGMSEEMIQQLFLKIGKPSRGTSNEKGFGIGLKFLQDILSKYQSNIVVKSKVGKGSTFTVVFPLKAQ